jgi:RNA-binding protein YhbY
MEMMLSEKQLNFLIKQSVNERLTVQEQDASSDPTAAQPTAGTSTNQSGGQGYPEVGKWESGIERGAGNQVSVTKWSDVVGSKLTRGHGNPLKEQNDLAFDRRYGTYDAAVKSNRENRELVNSIINMNPHTRNTILSLAALAIPIPFLNVAISSGIMAYDAKQYYDEGDTKTAGLMLMFSLLPAVGPIIGKAIPGIAKLGTSGMSSLAAKVRIGSKALNPTEIEVLEGIAKNRQLIQAEMGKSAKEISIKAARNKAQNKIVKSNISKGVKNTGKVIAGYTAAGVAYDQTYDAVERNIEQQNIRKLDQLLGTKN